AHSQLQPIALLVPDLLRELVAFDDRFRPRGIETHAGRELDQDIGSRRIAPSRVVCPKQRALELDRPALEPCPMQQPVRVERVPDMRARTEFEADGGAAVPDHRLHLRDLFGRAAVLASQVLHDLRALGRHVGIQLEGLDAHSGLDIAVQARERLVKRSETDRAPGARDIGDERNIERLCGHASIVKGKIGWAPRVELPITWTFSPGSSRSVEAGTSSRSTGKRNSISRTPSAARNGASCSKRGSSRARMSYTIAFAPSCFMKITAS